MLAIAIGTSAGMGTGIMPAQAQSDQQVRSLVEALRLAALQTGNPDNGLYSDWQIQAQNIPRWSQSCIGRTLTPQQFEADPATARNILVCVMRDVLQQEYRSSGNSEAIAVRRAAAWWMTGDPSRYDAGETAAYTQRVLRLYQQSGETAAQPPANPSGDRAAPDSPSNNSPNSSPNSSPDNPYDRYMRAGYAAVEQRNYEAALLHFRRALDERPNDTYAERAIENVESYRDRAGQNQSQNQSQN